MNEVYAREGIDLELTQLEADFIAEFKNILSHNGCNIKNIHFERRTFNYLSIVKGEDYDFCRFKFSNNAKWFSLSLWNHDSKLNDDSRLAHIANRNIRHWKIYIDSVEDLAKYADLITLSYNPADKETEFGEVIRYKDVSVAVAPDTNRSSKKPGKGYSLITFPDEYVVIDLETTGLSSEYDEIIEIAGIRVYNGKVIDTFDKLVKPNNPIDSYITSLTGITNDMVADADSIETVLPKFLTFLDDTVVVGHNVSFDVNFIYDNNVRCFNEVFSNDYVDTCRISRKLYPMMPHHRLGDLVKELNVPVSTYHRALNDCDMTLQCYEIMKTVALEKCGSEENFRREYFNKLHMHSQKLDARDITTTKTEFDTSHPLYGKVCVFTGTLERMKRADAMQLVVDLGGICGNSITAKTNYLILGNNDYCATIKDGKSSKQKKAEELRLKGKDITILPESAFYDMIEEG